MAVTKTKRRKKKHKKEVRHQSYQSQKFTPEIVVDESECNLQAFSYTLFKR